MNASTSPKLYPCLPCQGWQIIYRPEPRPAGITPWEAWDQSTGEILQASSHREIVRTVKTLHGVA